MVNYSASATALLALTFLATGTVNANSLNSMRRDGDKRQGLRKLNNNEHEVTDVQTQCDVVIEGNPKVCVKVCVEVTSITRSNGVVEEFSQVSQHKCDESWEKEAAPSVESAVDGWKCVPKTVTKSWSAPAEDGEKPPLWGVDEAAKMSVKSSKSSKESSGGKTLKNSNGLRAGSKPASTMSAWGAPASDPVPDVWSGGARRLSDNEKGDKRMLEWAAPAKPSSSGLKTPAAPTICTPSPITSSPETPSPIPSATPTTSNEPTESNVVVEVATPSPVVVEVATPSPVVVEVATPSPVVVEVATPSPVVVEVTTPSPTTCQERNWYFNGELCTNGYDEDGTYSSLLTCCEGEQQDNECKFEDVCCEMRPWYFDGVACTNGIAPDGDLFETVLTCCEAEQAEGECTFIDVCNPEPEVVATPIPTEQPTFGSTPTVSKEVTGPPTRGRS